MKNIILVFFAVLILAVTGYFSYLYGKTSSKPSMPVSISVTPELSPTGRLVGNDRDEHGCIGSAGYSWCAAKNKCLRVWEEGCPLPEDAGLIKAALYKKNNWPDDNSLTFSLTDNDGKYAHGLVNGQGGGGYFYAAKVNNVWKIVADGNGTIPCSALTDYPDFPKSLISACYDTQTDKLITR